MKQMRRWISAWTMAGILVSTYPGPAVSVWASEPVLVAGSGMAEAVLEKGTGQGEEQVTGDWETDGDRGGAGETEMAAASSDSQAGPDIQAPSAVLMEASTGQVVYEKNGDEPRSPASITKIMTLILIFDVIF